MKEKVNHLLHKIVRTVNPNYTTKEEQESLAFYESYQDALEEYHHAKRYLFQLTGESELSALKNIDVDDSIEGDQIETAIMNFRNAEQKLLYIIRMAKRSDFKSMPYVREPMYS